MLANAHAEENGSHWLFPHACRFLNARIAPSHIATDSEIINAALFVLRRNR